MSNAAQLMLDPQNVMRFKEVLRVTRELLDLLAKGSPAVAFAIEKGICVPASNLQADAGVPLDDHIHFGP
jgi:hypothetical protein